MHYMRMKNIVSCRKRKIVPLAGLVWPRGWVELSLFSSMTAALEAGE